ncbi:MAG TPA: phage portal protein [Acidimicrobiales bacterium]|nr:phage portal protein [Acidimicrobiales bacterium]
MGYVTDSGLVVTDRRYVRADDPRAWPPNDNVQPPPPVGAGPTTSEGFGNTHVMYPAVSPPPVQAWSGWPVEWATPTWGGATGLAEMTNRVSTVFGAIDLNASILSTMPPYRLVGRQVVDPLPWMGNPQPEVYTGWTEAMKQVVISYFNGEVFLWATSRYSDGTNGAPGTVRTWVVLNPGWVEVELAGQFRRYSMGGIDITDDVLHIRYSSWPGDPHGHGPLEALAYNLFGAAALERYQAGLAVRGGIPWGALTAPGNLSEPQATTMRDNFVAARLSAMGAPAVLSGGVTLTPFTINPKDMALLELRQFDEARIATLLCVPPTLLSLPTGDGSMTYRTVEGIYDFHWRAYLRPKAATLMEAISYWALPATQRVELNRDEYVRPAFAERIAGWSTLFNIHDETTGERAVTIDEIRSAERLNGLAGSTSVAS